ncbi:MAG: pseudouridine synthase [Thermoplasmatota archaeon]
MAEMRLQRYLALCGLGSRRSCEGLIAAGRVAVNGKIVGEPGVRVDGSDIVELDGSRIFPREFRYFLLNKPKGIICVDLDSRGRKYVVDLIPGGRSLGLFPVGRLDLDTTGLIIITNDGDIANRIAHPSYGIEKEYRALIKGRWDKRTLENIAFRGFDLDEGEPVKGVRMIDVKLKGERSLVTLRIHEGRKHVVRRLFLSIGSRVYELERTAVGELTLEGIAQGHYREIARERIEREVMGMVRE